MFWSVDAVQAYLGAVYNEGIAVDHVGRAIERLGSGGRSRCTGKQQQCDEAGDEHENDKKGYRRTYKYNPIGILYL